MFYFTTRVLLCFVGYAMFGMVRLCSFVMLAMLLLCLVGVAVLFRLLLCLTFLLCHVWLWFVLLIIRGSVELGAMLCFAIMPSYVTCYLVMLCYV